ncbi:MAG: cell wall metabolism sensor histidine kinase WalK [Candidatus Obscuribacterales bacterium]|nr:cell wall metabolism sensor histidine kinase WalK [Candidatus Obscuribacterales bacterium]
MSMGFVQQIYSWFWKTLVNQLLFTYLFVIAFALAIVTFWALFTIKSESIRDLRNSLEVESVHLALEIDSDLSLDSPQATARIQSAVDRHASRLGVSITVVNKSGHVLADSDDRDSAAVEKEGENISDEPEINDALGGIMAFYQRNSAKNRAEWLYVAYPVRSVGETVGVIRIGVPLTGLNQRLNQDLIFFLEIIVATLVTTALISLWLARRFTQPIRHMSELSRQIALSGDITTLVPVQRKDEIGELVSSFNQMIDRLREEEKLKHEFIANASHELKTPTMAISSVVEALQAGAAEDPELRQKFLVSLENLVERQASLLRDLLDIAQLDVSQKNQWQEDVNLAETLNEAIEQIRPQAEKKNIRLNIEMPDVAHIIVGNGIQLQRAFINLLTNAVNYTPANGEVNLGSNVLDHHVELRIEDTGSGIDPKDLPHIFQRFYRADRARTRTSGGTGLGLAITREIIVRHQGRIEVQSTLGEGTTFSVWLPLRREI